MSPAPAGRALGASYVLEELIGWGATGEVWRGYHRRSDEPVAAKILHREHLEDATLVERFVRERAILVRLRHPNVVAVRDLVVEDERLAIVMELVGGGSLRGRLRERATLRPVVALHVVAAVLDGLAAAHERAVVHLDVKPDNVLLAPGWERLGPGAVRLSDFGIAEILADRRTERPGPVGTPEYLAPELLVTGAGGTGADVYGAGVLLYELLAGRTPFAGPGAASVVAQRHLTREPPRLPLPEPVWVVVAALLAKEPERRPTAAEAAVHLRRAATVSGRVPALPPQDAPDGFRSAGAPTETRGIGAQRSEPAVSRSGTGARPAAGRPSRWTRRSPGRASARQEHDAAG